MFVELLINLDTAEISVASKRRDKQESFVDRTPSVVALVFVFFTHIFMSKFKSLQGAWRSRNAIS
jgi:hypothetical protein